MDVSAAGQPPWQQWGREAQDPQGELPWDLPRRSGRCSAPQQRSPKTESAETAPGEVSLPQKMGSRLQAKLMGSWPGTEDRKPRVRRSGLAGDRKSTGCCKERKIQKVTKKGDIVLSTGRRPGAGVRALPSFWASVQSGQPLGRHCGDPAGHAPPLWAQARLLFLSPQPGKAPH